MRADTGRTRVTTPRFIISACSRGAILLVGREVGLGRPVLDQLDRGQQPLAAADVADVRVVAERRLSPACSRSPILAAFSQSRSRSMISMFFSPTAQQVGWPE